MDDWRGRVIGAYRVVERLGQGGMGMVWRARDEVLERDVAIKMLLPDASASRENTARLLVEARAAACIKSRHVAQVLQLGTTDEGTAYVVMELLEGRTLLELVTRERRLTPARAVRIARHIATAMAAAHALGIVHRDLKPANVMLVKADGEDEVAKVLDFGIAKRTKSADERLTGSGVLLGTLHFMAPEQIEGRPVDTRADIYSLGVLLYRMLAGRAVFESPSLRELSDLVVFAPPRPVSDLVKVPKRLNDVVLRCLEKTPEQRYQTMAELDAALATSLEPETAAFVVAEPEDSTRPMPVASEAVDAGLDAGGDAGGDAADVTLQAARSLQDDDELAFTGVAEAASHRSAALVVAAAALALVVACLAIRGERRAFEGMSADGFVHVRTAGGAP